MLESGHARQEIDMFIYLLALLVVLGMLAIEGPAPTAVEATAVAILVFLAIIGMERFRKQCGV